MIKKTVLVVEDDANASNGLKAAIELEGYPVKFASNAQEALAILKKMSDPDLPGLIVLDLNQPAMNGRSFLKLLEAHGESSWAQIPVVLATEKESGLEQMPIGVESLLKPIELEELYYALAKHCRVLPPA